MTEERRLVLELEVIRIAIRAYLARLRDAWSSASADGGSADVAVASVGARAVPTAAELSAFDRLIAEAGRETSGAFARVVTAFATSLGEELLVASAWWCEADPQVGVAFGCANDDANRRFPSASLLRLLLQPFGVDAAVAIDDDHDLVRHGLLQPGAGSTSAVRLTAAARLFIAHAAVIGIQARRPSARHAEIVMGLARYVESENGIVALRGPAGVGKRAIACAAIAAAGKTAIGEDRPPAELKLLSRLGISVPVVPAITVKDLDWKIGDGPLVTLAGPDERGLPAGTHVIDIAAPDHAARTEQWSDELTTSGLDRAVTLDLAPVLAARFAFTEGDIEATLLRARRTTAWSGNTIDAEAVWDAARRQPEHALERVAALVRPAFTIDDLVLPADTQAQIGELISHVALQHQVLDGWGFRARMPRGQGVAALFTGPPGVGKTTAAEAVAHALKQDLYRIDLSLVVSKWVGETEKNLAAAFDEAERAGAVLFFDEADALFSKRTEVRDAHDRYANLEVNYLLQRIETFFGLAILATNRHTSIDDAFVRRLRFIIRFELPDMTLRRKLWLRSFPSGARRGTLDWDALAQADLAGGNIQSAALAAAYLAAVNGGTIRTAHLEHALRREYEKLGRSWPGLRIATA